MITPQEAESRVFTKASFGAGYNMAQVDAFLDILIADYAALYKENAALKGKMKVLAEKLEEYRATEDAMRRTLLTAQKMADSMVKEAEVQRVEAISKADAEAKQRIGEINRDVAREEARLNAARETTTTYLNRLKELYSHELEYIGTLADMTVIPEDLPQGDPVKAIEQSVSHLIDEELPASEEPAAEEPVAVQSEQEQPEEAAEPVAEDSAPAPEPEVEEKPQIVSEFDAELESITVQQTDTAAEGEEAEKPEEVNSDTVVFDRLQFGKDYRFE